MRSRPAVATAVTISAALTAAAVLARRTGRRVAATTSPAETFPPPVPVAEQDGVVLPFLRPAPLAGAAVAPELPVRCGSSGGRTKSGAPCAARATSSGRCHHHPLAA
jgi:hypothetical protein